jgi:hypothetical protein
LTALVASATILRVSAAGVHHRLPPRRTGVRLWSMRVLGLLGTAAVLGVGATAVVTVLPDRSNDTALLDEPSAVTGAPAAKHHKAQKPKLTAAQRRARSAAIAVLRSEGYRPVRLRDYAPANVLRVLVGRGEAGERAFFFAGGRFIGNDAADDSERIRVARAGKRSVALTYRLFKPGDDPCCPKGGTARVVFRWDGGQLAPQTAVPPYYARHAPTP